MIGFDDVQDAGLNPPSLSSVAVPARENGRRVASRNSRGRGGIDREYGTRGVPSQRGAAGRPVGAPVPNCSSDLSQPGDTRTVPVLTGA